MKEEKEKENDKTIDVIKKALKEYEKENDKKKRDRLFQDTKKVLRAYGQLEGYLQAALDHVDNELADKLMKSFGIQVEEGDEDFVHIHSIRRSKIRTAIILEHISRALESCEKQCIKAGEYNKYRAMIYIHVEGKEINEVAELLKCGESTARKWANEVIRKRMRIGFLGSDGAEIKI